MKQYTVKYRTDNIEWENIEKTYIVNAYNDDDAIFTVSRIVSGSEQAQITSPDGKVYTVKNTGKQNGVVSFGYDPFFNLVKRA